MKRAVLAPAARDELEAAAEWYESRAEGLGARFVLCIDEIVQRIEELPAGFPRWKRDPRFRRVVAQRFPYVVFYRDLPDQIEVVAVAHGAREPGYWLTRK
jgi:plasmid stabilization system protein ParE